MRHSRTGAFRAPGNARNHGDQPSTHQRRAQARGAPGGQPNKVSMSSQYVVNLDELRMSDVERVGGKNASLGEMIGQLAHAGVRVPGGFATTAAAFREFLEHDGLAQRIERTLAKLREDDVPALAKSGAEIRELIIAQPFPAALERDIATAYRQLQ